MASSALPRSRSPSPSPDLPPAPPALPDEILAHILATMCETDAELETDPIISVVDGIDLPPPYAALLCCIAVPNKTFSRVAQRQLYCHLHIRVQKGSRGPKLDSERLQISLSEHAHLGEATRTVTIALEDEFSYSVGDGPVVKRLSFRALGGIWQSYPRVQMVHLVGFGPQVSTELVEVIASTRPTLRRLALSFQLGGGIDVCQIAPALGRLPNLRGLEVHHAIVGPPVAINSLLKLLNLGSDALHILPFFAASIPSLRSLVLDAMNGGLPSLSTISTFTNLVHLEVWVGDSQSMTHVVKQTHSLARLHKLVLATGFKPYTLTQAKRFANVNLAALPPHLRSIELAWAALTFEVILGLLVSPVRDTCMIDWTEDPFTPEQREQMDKVVGDDNALRTRYSEAD